MLHFKYIYICFKNISYGSARPTANDLEFYPVFDLCDFRVNNQRRYFGCFSYRTFQNGRTVDDKSKKTRGNGLGRRPRRSGTLGLPKTRTLKTGCPPSRGTGFRGENELFHLIGCDELSTTRPVYREERTRLPGYGGRDVWGWDGNACVGDTLRCRRKRTSVVNYVRNENYKNPTLTVIDVGPSKYGM